MSRIPITGSSNFFHFGKRHPRQAPPVRKETRPSKSPATRSPSTSMHRESKRKKGFAGSQVRRVPGTARPIRSARTSSSGKQKGEGPQSAPDPSIVTKTLFPASRKHESTAFPVLRSAVYQVSWPFGKTVLPPMGGLTLSKEPMMLPAG